jgi:hypothetical protein
LAYTEVLKGKHKGGPFSLLPPEHIEEDPADEEIFCDPQFNPLISGGRDARVGEFPHLVSPKMSQYSFSSILLLKEVLGRTARTDQ